MSAHRWSVGENGSITSRSGQYCLTVVTVGKMPRFLVHSVRDRQSPLCASGTRETIPAAMGAAEALVGRLCRSSISAGSRPDMAPVSPAISSGSFEEDD
jgi:hypothetical protein